MNQPPPLLLPPPPRLSMDEYVALVADTVRRGDPARIARQKELEERIVKRFRIPDAPRPAPTDTAC